MPRRCYPGLHRSNFARFKRATRARRIGFDGALFLVHALSARRCRLIKDVDGLYESDPKASYTDRPKRYEHLRWDEALALESGVVQHKALKFAADNKLSFEVTALGGASGTWVGEKRA